MNLSNLISELIAHRDKENILSEIEDTVNNGILKRNVYTWSVSSATLLPGKWTVLAICLRFGFLLPYDDPARSAERCIGWLSWITP